MERSSTTKPLHITPRPFSHTNSSNANSRFFSLPLEIRLIIYDKLLVQSNDLLRTFCTCIFCANLKNPTIGRDRLNPSLLRTNKAIYGEALPILYSKNVFSFFCYGPFAYTNPINISRHRSDVPGTVERAGLDGSEIGLIANRHCPWAGVAKIMKCPSEGAKSYVRRTYFKLDWVYHTVLENFPNQWWQPVESTVLAFFPGLEQIKVQISAKDMPVLALYLVFQRKDLMVARKLDYKSILADAELPLHPEAGAREGLRNIEAICDAVVASQTQGEMKDCSFGVRLVSWTDDYLIAAGSKAMMGISTSIKLGCC